ncbi:Glycosyltransferase-like protein [Flavobacteria bacterium BAL38]|nr:Glycosyltransferase-like protein [Flavobacteria bacterium BAL38]
MKIAILGTRGVPNYYGGFEQFAEFFSVYLAERGHEVYCYNSHNHPYQEKTFHGVHILHQHDPEYKYGTFGQFIYDYNCIMDARKRDFDVILQLGYTSNSIWFFLMPKKAINIINMDGLEWKRSKYSWPIQQFLKVAEWLAARSGDYLVADSLGIQTFLKEKYKKESTYIAYGAHLFDSPNESILQQYQVEEGNYNMVMARFEPENNLDMVLEGVALNKEDKTPILVIGKHETKYGAYLKNKFKDFSNIRFIGGVYNLEHLNNLRYFSNLYFHGHSVGGTNPSLLEAMASKALVIAHNNNFNKGVLKENAYYFSNPIEVKKILNTIKKNDNLQFISNNYQAIANDFNWEKINGDYLQLFEKAMAESSIRK